MGYDEVLRFADSWLLAWNSHDLQAILDHFDDGVVFTSPLARQLVAGSDGVIRGKVALGQYWAEGLRRLPMLHFSIEALYVGTNTIVINYRNHVGNLVNEVLVFAGDRVIEGHATYRNEDAATTSGVEQGP